MNIRVVGGGERLRKQTLDVAVLLLSSWWLELSLCN